MILRILPATLALAVAASGFARAAEPPPPAAAEEAGPETVVTVTNLDALIRQAGHDKHLGRLAAVLLLCKGLGRTGPDGTTTWHIAEAAGHVSVNGMDVTGLVAK